MKPVSALLLSALMLTAAPAAAQDWALQGYDAVSYQAENRAEPGQAEIHTMWKGQLWLFVSEQHRVEFEGNPRAYAPAFDGLCPVALAEGEKVAGDPRFFAVISHRLYLARDDSNLRALLAAPDDVLGAARQRLGKGD